MRVIEVSFAVNENKTNKHICENVIITFILVNNIDIRFHFSHVKNTYIQVEVTYLSMKLKITNGI